MNTQRSNSIEQRKIMNKLIKFLALGVTASALVISGAISSPANADSPLTVTVTKTTGLALAGESVNVSVSGIPNGQGVYVYQCAASAVTPRPDATKCRSGMAESLWLTTNGGMGAGVASQSNPLSLVNEFTIGAATFNCSLEVCGIFVRRDHMGGSSDFTLDTIVPIEFETATPDQEINVVSAGSATPKLKKAFTTSQGFDSGSSRLGSAAKANLKKKIGDYRLASTITITAEAALTSGVSSKKVTNLAKKRAEAVKKYLVQQGISASKIVIKTELMKSRKKPTTKIVATP
jgi:hypothetical protein